MASDIADRLKAGGRVLIHCGAGIGRTGTLATCVLLALGDAYATAAWVVADAGSHPETAAQRELVSWCAARVRTARPE
jgi:protein-tyrosine phosphatase